MSKEELKKAFRRNHKQHSKVACAGCGAAITVTDETKDRKLCVICLARTLNTSFHQSKIDLPKS